jgi:tetratricopeptide (TPR) repeat protein
MSNENKCTKFRRYYTESLKKSGNDTTFLLNSVSKFIDNGAECLDAYLTRADLYLSLNELKFAEKDYKYALQVDSNNIYTLYRLGIVYSLFEDHATALSYFEKALKRKQKGNILIDYKTDVVTVDRFDINSNEIIYQLGLSYYYNRNMKKALINFNYCIAANYLLAESFLYRGAVYFETNQKDKACEDFDRSIELGNPQAKGYKLKFCN